MFGPCFIDFFQVPLWPYIVLVYSLTKLITPEMRPWSTIDNFHLLKIMHRFNSFLSTHFFPKLVTSTTKQCFVSFKSTFPTLCVYPLQKFHCHSNYPPTYLVFQSKCYQKSNTSHQPQNRLIAEKNSKKRSLSQFIIPY